MRIIFMLTLTSILLMSCGGSVNQTTEEKGDQVNSESLMEEVMAIHDEVMPLMGSLRKKGKEFEAQLDSLQGDDLEQIQAVETKIAEVKDATEGMMNWMRNFEPDSILQMAEADQIKALKEEKAKILKVNKRIKDLLGVEEK